MQPYILISFHPFFSYKFDLIIFCSTFLCSTSPTLEIVNHRTVTTYYKLYSCIILIIIFYNQSHYFILSFSILQLLYERHRNVTSMKCIEKAWGLEQEIMKHLILFLSFTYIIYMFLARQHVITTFHIIHCSFARFRLSIRSLNTLEKSI